MITNLLLATASKASDGAEVSDALAKRLALAKLALGADEADLAVCNAPHCNVCSAYFTLGANIPLMFSPKTSHSGEIALAGSRRLRSEYDIASIYMVSFYCFVTKVCTRRPGLPQACRSG
jgi:hypothetical protein